MTIFQGTHGSICLYYKGILISNFPLTEEKTIERYIYQGDEIIRSSKGIPIKIQIKTYLQLCNMVYARKKANKGIRRSDHLMFMNALMALMRLKIIENDDDNGYLECVRKRPRCLSRSA
tara:strand:- start:462 stop:818 length:357 start_codon:yes stop_codon:yes gene_type:complete